VKLVAEDFHHIKFPANGTKKFWECVAERANEKLEEKQRATPDPRTEEIVELLERSKYLEEQLLIAHNKNTELKGNIAMRREIQARAESEVEE